MLGAAQRYEELRFELLLRRTLGRGKLPQAVEADFAAELQRCWDAMTDDEQEQVEKSLTSDSIPSTAADLAQQDEHVPDGGSSLPRRPVAEQYQHGPRVWQGLPPNGIPDRDPGVLIYQSLSGAPPGNRVRSYLDIVAPDETPGTEIRQGFLSFVSQSQREELPWIGVVGRCWFRINMDLGLASVWQREVVDLFLAAQSARIGG